VALNNVFEQQAPPYLSGNATLLGCTLADSVKRSVAAGGEHWRSASLAVCCKSCCVRKRGRGFRGSLRVGQRPADKRRRA
jgi:hypothetical protein